ncbi:P-loop containing nucleoside triphosphate hydrolase protein [Poronia punctata]|nr:P-loop containing nucleoside triphosphate hydrolase protein [Poronia punctata]
MPSAAPYKRSRQSAFHDDGSDDEQTFTRTASSSLRNDTRKKARLSGDSRALKARRANAAEDDEPTVGSDDHDSAAPPATQYELTRDNGFKHLDHTELDDQLATQRLKERPSVLAENHEALNAIIESITCINFMCHVRLHVELGPLLNFIVGENGSGKSAVLTAITLCLGGKASATNRGGSLKSFVKEGTEHASLIVRLKNQGEDSYMPDLYGDSIICERWFTKSGSSGFKVKSAAGRIISTKKADVDDIVEYYCLQVDNPLNVLSQDNARQFLNSASPLTKYAYFVKGTQLEKLDDDYKLIMNSIEDHEVKLRELDENLTYAREKFTKAVQLRDAASKAAEMRHRIQVYTNQLAWAAVEEEEETLKEKEAAIVAAMAEISRAEGLIAEKAGALEKIDDLIQQKEESLESERQEETRATEAEDEIKQRFEAIRKSINELHASERHMHTNLEAASKAVKKYERSIVEEEQRLEEVSGGAMTKIQKELDAAIETRKRIEQERIDHKADLQPLQEAEQAAIAKAEEPANSLARKREEIQSAESGLRVLSQARRDPLDSFEPKMRQLLKVIDDDKGFAQKPIGPLGAFIQLTKPEWMSILEKYIGQGLAGFIVGSKADQARLMGHMDRLRIYGSSVYIGNAALNNLREPDAKFDTILRVLKFDDQRVRDHLIINNHIEQTLLIESRSTAEDVMFGGPPENSGSCLAFHDLKKGHGVRITNIRGNLSTSPISPNPSQKPRMKTDQDSQVNYYKEQLMQLNAEYQEIEGLRRAAEQAVQRARRATAQHKQREEQLKREGEKAQVAVNNIQASLDEFDGTDGRLQGLKEALKEEQERKDHYGNQYAEVAIKKTQLNEEADELKKELSQAHKVASDHNARVIKAKDKIERLKETRRLALSEKNAAHDNRAVAEVAKTEAEAARDRQAKVLEDSIGEATEVVSQRAYIPEGETKQSIERKYESTFQQMRRLTSQMGGSEAEINHWAGEAKRDFNAARQNVKSVRQAVEILKNSLVHRLGKYRDFQRHVSAQARCNFSYLLSERGFRGMLLLDHKNKKLEVQVEPDKTLENGRGRNTKTLSGGEKSFSSICLLLAIWDAMGSPLRCLDEFDVFMDNVNRAISTNMLIEAARRSVGKQFILITPNAIEGRAKLDKDVKIIRLTDPRQQRLPDMVQ